MDPHVAAKDLLHLQCHFGLDTLAWGPAGSQGDRGRLLGAGRRAGPAPGRRDRAGRPLRGLGRGRPPATLEGDFDVVFTSFGVLSWLPDVPRWAEVVAHFVRPGGFFAEAAPSVWRLPGPDDARLPLLFSLKATKA